MFKFLIEILIKSVELTPPLAGHWLQLPHLNIQKFNPSPTQPSPSPSPGAASGAGLRFEYSPGFKSRHPDGTRPTNQPASDLNICRILNQLSKSAAIGFDTSMNIQEQFELSNTPGQPTNHRCGSFGWKLSYFSDSRSVVWQRLYNLILMQTKEGKMMGGEASGY